MIQYLNIFVINIQAITSCVQQGSGDVLVAVRRKENKKSVRQHSHLKCIRCCILSLYSSMTNTVKEEATISDVIVAVQRLDELAQIRLVGIPAAII